MLVAVKGKVEHGSEVAKPFSQSFLLMTMTPNDAGSWRITNDCFRILE